MRRLLGSPALVQDLEGAERRIAVGGYMEGLKALFLAGMGVAVCMVFVQAGTGWRGGDEGKGEETEAEGPLLVEERIAEEGV